MAASTTSAFDVKWPRSMSLLMSFSVSGLRNNVMGKEYSEFQLENTSRYYSAIIPFDLSGCAARFDIGVEMQEVCGVVLVLDLNQPGVVGPVNPADVGIGRIGDKIGI